MVPAGSGRQTGGMRATTIHAPFDIRSDDVAEPSVLRPTDAVVRVTASCVCGSDLWRYRGESDFTPGARIGHEFVGVVEAVGEAVSTVTVGDFVITPFTWGDNTCRNCANGINASCENGGGYGMTDREGMLVDGGQGELVRVPLADGTLVSTPTMPSESQLPDLLALSDAMGTGWHCARGADVEAGDTVAVIGDGAVGLSAVLAARLMGAARIIVMSRHEARQQIATEWGASDIVEKRGEAGEATVLQLTDGLGVDAALECVGTDAAMQTAIAVTRPAGRVGYVGVPHGIEMPMGTLFSKNLRLGGGVASVRQYLPELRDRVLAGEIHPGRVFDLQLPLAEVAEGYAAMHERRSIKTMLLP